MAGKLEDRVREIIVDQLGVNAEQVTTEASFIDDLGADSLDSVELIMAFEEEFGAAIPEEDAEKLTIVGKVIPRRHWHVISCLTGSNFVQTEILTSFKGPKTPKNYRCTRPVPFPAASASTSETVTRLKSCSIECFRQDAATAKSIEA